MNKSIFIIELIMLEMEEEKEGGDENGQEWDGYRGGGV